MKKKIVIAVVALIVVLSLITGRSKSGKDKKAVDSRVSETVTEAEKKADEEPPEKAATESTGIIAKKPVEPGYNGQIYIYLFSIILLLHSNLFYFIMNL